MATKSLELLLELVVKGDAGDLAAVQRAIEELQKEATKLKSIAQLREILGADKALPGIQAVSDAISRLKAGLEITEKARFFFDSLKAMQGFKLDIDLGKLQTSLTTIGHEANNAYQNLLKLNKGKVDLDVTQANKNLDLIVQKGRALIDLPLTLAKRPLDIDVSKLDAGLKRVKKSGDDVKQSFQGAGQAARDNEGHFRLLNTTIGSVASNLLFLRRILIATVGVDIGSKVLETVSAFDKLNLSMSAVFKNDAPAELAFIRSTADRLGLSITDLASNWAKFAASVDTTKVSLGTMRENFLAVSEAGSRLGLSTEEINGTLTALSQIASKGRLSMEELRQQLGDRLPGAVRIAADALGLTQAKLFALIEQGKISSDVFLNAFPAALRKSFGTDQATRIETIGAAVQRFKNSLQELINSAVRSGALDTFRKIIDDLATSFKDPDFVNKIGEVAKALADLALWAAQNVKVLGSLFAAFVAFKTISGVRELFTGITATLVSYFGAAKASAEATTVLAGGMSTMAKGASTTSQAVSGAALAAEAFGKTLASAAITATAAAAAAIAIKVALDALYDSLIKSKTASFDLATAQREAASNERLAKQFTAQAEALKEFGNVSVLTAEQVGALSQAQAITYKEGVDGATALAAAQEKAAASSIKAAQEQLTAIRLSGENTAESRKKVDDLLISISQLKDAQAAAAARGLELAGAFKALEERGDASGRAINSNADAINRLFVGADVAAAQLQKVANIDLSKLNKDTKFIVDGFTQATEKGDKFAKAIETALPKNWLDGASKNISDVGNALAFLVQEGLLPAGAATDQLAKDLAKLDANQLVAFGIQAQNAFDLGKLSAQGLTVVLDGQLKASLNKLGVDAEFAGTNISKQFDALNTNFETLASNVRASSAQIKEGLNVTIAAAKTREELQAIASTVDALGLRTGKFGKDLEDAFLRLDDKIRLTAGTLNSALGDSFDRLGIKTKTQLTALADQATVDFNRIKVSGVASALELEAAFRKMADEITKATQDGIPPIKLRFAAIDNNAFDILVKSAETAGEHVRKAIENAIPLADTKAKLQVLADGIQTAFENGKLSVQDFGLEMTKVGFALREAIAKPVGDVLAVVETFGFKTKDQLTALSDNAKEAFQIMASSGEFTTSELVKGAQAYLDAYSAANNGVIDTFDPVIAKAQELVKSVDAIAKKTDEIKGVGAQDAIGVGNLRDQSIPQLQLMLSDLSKAYRAIGIQNVQDLQIIQAIQKEITRQANIDAEARRKAIDDAASVLDNAAGTLKSAVELQNAPATGKAPGGSVAGLPAGGLAKFNPFGSGDTIINLNGSGALTVDAVKRQVVPALRDIQLRRG